MCNVLLKHRVNKNIHSNFQSYSDDKFHIVNVNDIIFTREKEDSDAYYFATVVKVCSEHWIKVKCHWEVFTALTISTVRVNWIHCDSARKTSIPNYSDDNIVLNFESLVAPGRIVHFIQH